MLEIVLVNLLSNAVKFTPENGGIKIEVQPVTDFVQVKVTDTGVGIEPGAINNIFKIDKKHKTAGTSGEEGSGLGLIVCQEFIHKNGGEITVQSEVGKGTTFAFTIPLV